MRAYAIDSFGQPSSIHELPTPVPAPGEVLIRVTAAGVNGFDAFVVSGMAKDFMEHRFPLIPGIDFSGVVAALGADVDGFAVGDEIFGVVERPYQGAGSMAESVAVLAASISARPTTIDLVHAAGLPTTGLTAISAFEAIKPESGQVIVVLGATGGVGTYAVQLLAAAGARVIAVTRAVNADYARELGAAESVDYTAGDVVDLIRASHPDGIDAVIDFVGDAGTVTRLADLVHREGRVASSGGGLEEEALEARGLQATRANRVATTQVFPLDRAGEALELMASRHVRGKLVVSLD